ncbi:MAG: GNAT family N-acetyltransferase [Sciscionella sp.]
MTELSSLVEQQSAAHLALDPLLPPAFEPPEGEVLTAHVPGGERVAGVLTRTRVEAGTLPSLWSAQEVSELHPLVGSAGAAGVAELLARWRSALGSSISDSACLLHWPSRDAATARVLLDHGLIPLTVLAVRTAPPPAPTPARTVTIRPVGESDLEVAVGIEMTELCYSAQVGGAVLRGDAEQLKRKALRYRFGSGDLLRLAEFGGVPVALAECRIVEHAESEGRGHRVNAGRWGYVNCASVVPVARGKGIGRQLMTAVHRELHQAGATASYLYYNPPNPLSSVFWPRQGYRPLWTLWEVRPAGALR